MSETTAKVADTLSRHPDGITARKLAGQANLPLPAVGEALTAMEAAGTATRVSGEPTGTGNRKPADLWKPTANEPPSDAPTADTDAASDTAADAATTPDTSEATTDEPASDANPSDAPTATPTGGETGDTPTDPTASAAPVSGPPVSGAPVDTADHFKIVMVAGVLGDHPDGVSAATVVDESGLRAAIVARVLAAMEVAGAAVRKPSDDEAGVELWVRGDGDLSTVSLANVATYTVCPTCGHRARVRTTVGTRRAVSTAPGHNSNGQRTLGKNELRTIVGDFLRAHPGHEFTAGTIAREIDRSPGAVGNALAKLVTGGEAVLVEEAPMTYSAAPTTAGAPANP